MQIVAFDGQAWRAEYTGDDGETIQHMVLDAQSEDEAVFEAAALLGVNEDEIQVEYEVD